MRNLLQLLSKYSILLMFVALEIVSLVLVVRNNEYQRNAFFTSANVIAGWNYSVYAYCAQYFNLREENRLLQEENIQLQNQLLTAKNELQRVIEKKDSGYVSAELNKHYISARVINISSSKRHNYLTINRGERDSLKKDMGVINCYGVVGIINNTSRQFATVIPIINTSMQLSCKIKNNDACGPLVWNGKNYRYANLTDIAKHITVNQGDTIVTSGFTPTFPEGIMVGVVEEVSTPQGSSYHSIKVRLAADYKSLGYVSVIADRNLEEQKKLEGEYMD